MYCGTVLKMKFVFIALISVCVAEMNLEATDGDNVTIHLEFAELDKADQVKVTLTRAGQKNLIARYCGCDHCGDCNAVETPGVSLRVKERTLVLLDVSCRDSGLYEVKVIRRNNTSERQRATLAVSKCVFSKSREPPQTFISKPPQTFISKPPQTSISKPPQTSISKPPQTFISKPPQTFISKPPQTFISKPPQTFISKPPNSSERQRIFVVIAPVVFIMVVICLFCKCKRVLMLKQPEKPLMSPDLVS